jgi:uncharacterized protein YdgA (DUF945 family)
MKKIALILAVLILLFAAAPWVSGAFTERQFAADVARIEDNDYLAIDVVEYDRGWATSTALLEVGLTAAQLAEIDEATEELEEVPPGMARLDDRIRLLVTMRHGPVMFGPGGGVGLMATTVQLDPETPGLAELVEELGIEQLVELRAVTDFGGRSTFVAEVPPLTLARDDVDLDYTGLNITGSYDGPTRHLIADSNSSSLTLAAKDLNVAVENLRFANDSTRYNGLFRLGRSESSIERFTLGGGSAMPWSSLEATNIEAVIDFTLEDGGEHVTMETRYTADSLTGGDALFNGIPLDLASIEVAAAARRLPIEALSEYYALSRRGSPQPNAAAPVRLEMEDVYYRLLQASPVVEVSALRFDWNGEPFAASLTLAVDAANLPPRPAFTVMSPMLFVGLVSVDATLAVSATIAEFVAIEGLKYQLRQTTAASGEPFPEDQLATLAEMQAAVALAGLVAQGMLEATDTGYATQARFVQGKLTVNGTPIPLGLP